MTTATLTADEMNRVRRELDDNILAVGAWPFVDIKNVYTIIQNNVQSSATPPTTSSTAITAVGPGTITVASVTGLIVGVPIALDVDDYRESVTIKSISGLVIGANFRKLHAGTFNVEPESALTITRGLMFDLSRIQDEINQARSLAGIKSSDDAEFFGGKEEKTVLDELRAEQSRLRMDLASQCGLREYFAGAERRRRGGGGSFSIR